MTRWARSSQRVNGLNSSDMQRSCIRRGRPAKKGSCSTCEVSSTESRAWLSCEIRKAKRIDPIRIRIQFEVAVPLVALRRRREGAPPAAPTLRQAGATTYASPATLCVRARAALTATEASRVSRSLSTALPMAVHRLHLVNAWPPDHSMALEPSRIPRRDAARFQCTCATLRAGGSTPAGRGPG